MPLPRTRFPLSRIGIGQPSAPDFSSRTSRAFQSLISVLKGFTRIYLQEEPLAVAFFIGMTVIRAATRTGGSYWEVGLVGRDRVLRYGQTIGLTHGIGYSLITDT